MKEYTLVISSPKGDIFRGDVTALYVRGTEGELAVMAGHIPFVTAVVPCECRIELADGTDRSGTMEGGILTVGNEETVLLSGSFSWNE